MTNQNIPDGRLVAEQNEQAILHWLHRFGGLTTRQLARLVWPKKTAGQRMAQRTVGRLEQQQLVLQRSLFTGGKIYVISQRGAHLLRELGTPNVSARGHRDLSFRKPMHRIIANDFLIDWRDREIINTTASVNIWTEFEVQHRLGPYPEISIKGKYKIPDGMIQIDDELTWIEVENAYKGPKEIERLIMAAARFFNDSYSYPFRHNGAEYRISRFFFILPHQHNFNTIANAIYKSNLDFNALKCTFLVKVNGTSGLVWQGIEGFTSAYDVVQYIKEHDISS